MVHPLVFIFWRRVAIRSADLIDVKVCCSQCEMIDGIRVTTFILHALDDARDAQFEIVDINFNQGSICYISVMYYEEKSHHTVAIRNDPDGSFTYHNSSPTHRDGMVRQLSFQDVQDFQISKISGLLYSELKLTHPLVPLRSIKFHRNNCYLVAALMIAAAHTRLVRIAATRSVD